MNLVERVARLLYLDDVGEPMQIDPSSEFHHAMGKRSGEPIPEWTRYREPARRILEAMREDPMAAQLRADAPRAIGTWHTIIDAELAADIEQHGQP